MWRRLIGTYWRGIAAVLVLVITGSNAISTMTAPVTFTVSYTDLELTCSSMFSAPGGPYIDLYVYGRGSANMTDEQFEQYVEASGLTDRAESDPGSTYQRLDANLAQACSDQKSSQGWRLVATLGMGILLLAFLAVPFGRGRRDRGEA